MRPVNLIPPEDRRGDRAPLRAGALSYIVVGTCAAALVAVLGLVLTQNSITDRENEIAELEVARNVAAQRAEALAPYAEFASLQEQREQTIQSLAQSRFDWERVLRELALVIPGDITLENLTASATGVDESGTATTAGGVSGPSLAMSGCGPTHDDVAEFVAALEDIDGVTRVGLESSTRGGDAGEGSSAAGSAVAGGGSKCPPSSTTFSLRAVFDGVTLGVPAETAPTAPASETNSPEEQVQESREAANLVPGTAR